MQKEINFFLKLLCKDFLFRRRKANEKNDIFNCNWMLITKDGTCTIEEKIVRAVSFLKIILKNHLISF